MRRDDWLLAQLPVGMVEDDFFVRFVSIFQELAGSIMDGADNLDNVVDVTVAPEPMVRWLASWIGVDVVDASLPGPLQRKIVQASARMLAWRGTHHGLQQFLELVSGGPAEIDDSGGVFAEGAAPDGPPRVRMRVGSTGWLPEADFVALVRDEVPAHVEVELWVGERQLLPGASLLPAQRADVEWADSQWARPVPEQRAEHADPSQADPSQADPSQADPSQADPSQADPSQPDRGAAPKNGEVEP